MNVQPGLIDDHLEIYAVKGEAFCTYKKQVYRFPDFPEPVLLKLIEDFENNPRVLQAIRQEWGITDDTDALHKYIICRFGGLDFLPDLSSDSGELTPDYHHCPVRATCPFDGIICAPLQGANGHISERERQVLVHISSGKMEKEIADVMDISIVTVKKHRKSLFDKTGAQSSVQLSAFAYSRNLIPPSYA